MLREVPIGTTVPERRPVRCDLAVALPFARGSMAGVWASKAHQHLPADELPRALAEVHRVVAVGARFDLTMFAVPRRRRRPRR